MGFDSLSGPWRHGGTTRAPLEYYALGLDSWEYIASFAFAVIFGFVVVVNSAFVVIVSLVERHVNVPVI